MSEAKYRCSKCGSLRVLHNTWEAYNPEDMPWGWQVGITSKDWCDDCVGFCEITDEPLTSNPPEGGIGGTVSSASEPIDQP